MKIEITQWLQEEIEKHADHMACVEVASKNGGEANDYYAVNGQDLGFWNEGSNDNPSDGEFVFKVSSYASKYPNQEKIIVKLTIREVLKDYVKG